jgi:hypothetical protein
VINRLTREAQGAVLAEEPYFVIANAKPHLLGDPFLSSILMERGTLDPKPLLKDAAAGRIHRIFAGFRLKSIPGLKEILSTRYRLIYETRTPVLDSYLSVYEHIE